MGELVTLLVTSVLINNVILNQFLGMCPFMGVSKKRSSAIGMGVAVMFVIVVAAIVTYGFVLSCIGTTRIRIHGFDYVHSCYRIFGTVNGNVYQENKSIFV